MYFSVVEFSSDSLEKKKKRYLSYPIGLSLSCFLPPTFSLFFLFSLFSFLLFLHIHGNFWLNAHSTNRKYIQICRKDFSFCLAVKRRGRTISPIILELLKVCFSVFIKPHLFLVFHLILGCSHLGTSAVSLGFFPGSCLLGGSRTLIFIFLGFWDC